MDKLGFLILGGSLGTVSRYWVSTWMMHWLGPVFPFGTLVVNMVGCFVIGLIAGLPEGATSLPVSMRLLLMSGFLGALTTFSSYEYESFLLARDGQYWKMFVNLGGSMVIGLMMVYLGFITVRMATGYWKGA